MSVNYNSKIVTDGLVMYLDAANSKSYLGTGTTWFDLSGNGNNGTLVNGLSYSSNNAGNLVFNGTNNFITIPEITLLSSGSTVSAWLNIADFSTGKSSTGRVFIRGDSNFNRVVAFYNGGYSIETNTNGNPHEIAGRTTGNVLSSQIIAGSWFHFALVFNSGVFTGYINSIQTGSASITNNLTVNRIGDETGYDANYPSFFKGNMNLFSVYNRALSTNEIQQNFNAIRGRFGI